MREIPLTTIDLPILYVAIWSLGTFRSFKTVAFLHYFLWIVPGAMRFSVRLTAYAGLLSVGLYTTIAAQGLLFGTVQAGSINTYRIVSLRIIPGRSLRVFRCILLFPFTDGEPDSNLWTGMTYAIEFIEVTKRFGDKAALNRVSLGIETERITSLIGPSGSGKSTLLQMVNALHRPDSGVVKIHGKTIDYKNLTALRRSIGYAVQGTGLFPHMTVERNITILSRLEKWDRPRREKRVEELMELVNLPRNYLERYPNELSGGEQQRVGICRAMMLKPDLFLLDEAFGSLDPITRGEIHEELLRIQRAEPRTILLVTHDLSEAMHLSDRIAILNEGILEQEGEREDIVHHPASPFVRNFFHNQLQKRYPGETR